MAFQVVREWAPNSVLISLKREFQAVSNPVLLPYLEKSRVRVRRSLKKGSELGCSFRR